MRFAVRLRWETKEKGRKDPCVGNTSHVFDAEDEARARVAALDWHTKQKFGGIAEVEAIDLLEPPQTGKTIVAP